MAHHADGRHAGSGGPVERDDLLEALFHEALELDETERVDYARRQCAGDPELAEELSALLSAHRSAPACLEQPAWGEDGPGLADKAGDTIGPYHLLHTLGEGGMGTVYLAQQLRPLRRSVALKLIKPGMDTREVVARFDAERQVLAQLNHPHIAAVYDAGITPRGRPYFAMEYVPGERITRYCDERKLPLRERLLLFRSVCDAVHHAHQKGVIHRDLKPGNILVTEIDGKPVPKIIDFGVAKAIHTDAGGRGTLCTRRGQIIGTPSYMSPEQAGAFPAAVDSRTDVYSLGVLLNELLTGFLPYELGSLRGADDDDVRRRLSEVEVVRPALRVAMLGLRARKAAARRDCDPRSLSRQLRGDLDWIVLKALERDPEARYASASELGADVANHLDGEPVTASSPGALYRARKLIAKNRGVVASVAGLIVMGFVALLAFAVAEADRAEELSHENAVLVDTHDAEMQAVLEREDTLLAERDSARDEFPYSTAVIRNRGDSPLQVGEIVELIGVGDAHESGRMVVDVVRATAGSGRPPLGSIDGLWAPQEGREASAHRQADPVPPGGLGVAVTHGLFARVRVDGSCGEILANDPLGVSAVPGLACLHDGAGAVVGFALDEWTVSQRGLIRAFVAPMPEFVTVSGSSFGSGRSGLPLASGPSEPIASSARLAASSGQPGGEAEALADAAGGAVADDAHRTAGEWGGAVHDPAIGVLDSAPAPLAGAVVVVAQTDSIDAEAGPGTSAGDTKSGGGAHPEPLVPHSGVAVSSGTSGQHGRQPIGLESGGVGRHVPGETGGTMQEPPGSGGTPPTGGGVGPSQGGGQLFGLSGGLDDADGDAGTDGDGDADDDDHAPPTDDGVQDNLDGLVQLWGDVDGDGLLDVLIQSGDEPFSLRQNAGGSAFDDITDWSGLGEHASRVERPVAWLDADGDGALDLLAVGHDERLVLFHGRGEGRFDEVFEAAGLAVVKGVVQVSLFDIDGNGAPDVRVSTRGNGLLLLINDGAGRFGPVVLRAPDEQDSATTAEGSPSAVTPRGG